ncbi:MAG: hypothetical protein KatS3mg081_1636 [Gemmatimonadales bacterium]|nr:MAG: hypothetical protein KatS3mg081_1636 [Gemmatimonadales bacterium]
MPRKAKTRPEAAGSATSALGPVQWLRAEYHLHVFHYRMPETVAIAAVTPFVPSPLTLKMALVAALLQSGDEQSARTLVPHLPKIEVRIVPPFSAISFKAFLRYRSVPAVESTSGLDESGSYYPSRPHTRDYALFSDALTVFLGLPDTAILETVKKALWDIRYLGCKDSMVTCLSVQEVSKEEAEDAKSSAVQPLREDYAGAVILGADFDPSARLSDLKDLIPGARNEAHYRHPAPVFVVPATVTVKGRTPIFVRSSAISPGSGRRM